MKRKKLVIGDFAPFKERLIRYLIALDEFGPDHESTTRDSELHKFRKTLLSFKKIGANVNDNLILHLDIVIRRENFRRLPLWRQLAYSDMLYENPRLLIKDPALPDLLKEIMDYARSLESRPKTLAKDSAKARKKKRDSWQQQFKMFSDAYRKERQKDAREMDNRISKSQIIQKFIATRPEAPQSPSTYYNY